MGQCVYAMVWPYGMALYNNYVNRPESPSEHVLHTTSAIKGNAERHPSHVLLSTKDHRQFFSRDLSLQHSKGRHGRQGDMGPAPRGRRTTWASGHHGRRTPRAQDTMGVGTPWASTKVSRALFSSLNTTPTPTHSQLHLNSTSTSSLICLN
jgi:hypothetical protein